MKSVAIAASSSGANTLVAGVAGQKIRVLSFQLSFSGSVNAKFQTSTGPADLTGLFYGAAHSQVSSPALPPSQHGGRPQAHFETLSGDDLVLNLSGATAVGGVLLYETLPASLSQQ